MWERHSFYILAFTLLLYIQDKLTGGLGLSAGEANEIVGTYLAFVYFTPFLGGLLADRYLGFRRSVFIGGLCMAGGCFVLATPTRTALWLGLALVCIGNGFFKPNISAMVGNLYEKGDPKRDAGFNIFYMGINIGAFIAPLTAAMVRNTPGWGWPWMFRAAGIGLGIGVALLLAFWKPLERADRAHGAQAGDVSLGEICLKILLPAFAISGVAYLVRDRWLTAAPLSPEMWAFLAGAVPILFFFVRLGTTASKDEKPGLLALLPLFLAGATFFMILHLNTTALTNWANQDTDRHSANAWDLFPGARQEAPPEYFRNAARDVPRPDERSLLKVSEVEERLFGVQQMEERNLAAILSAAQGAVRAMPVEEEREGSAPDAARKRIESRSVRIYPDGSIQVSTRTDSHGQSTIEVQLADEARELRKVAFVRDVDGQVVPVFLVSAKTYDDIFRQAGSARLGLSEPLLVTNPELFGQVNSLCVIFFTPLIVAFFQWLQHRGRGVTTARKIFSGLLWTMASMAIMVFAGWLTEGSTQKVSWLWLVGTYAIVTVGELCLSPMGLSLVTKLSPARYVGLMMGGWFVATAFGNKLSGFFGGIQSLMDPMWFFVLLAGLVLAVALFIRAVLPSMDSALKKYGA
jgi:dipeptide/tripeptide permease